MLRRCISPAPVKPAGNRESGFGRRPRALHRLGQHSAERDGGHVSVPTQNQSEFPRHTRGESQHPRKRTERLRAAGRRNDGYVEAGKTLSSKSGARLTDNAKLLASLPPDVAARLSNLQPPRPEDSIPEAQRDTSALNNPILILVVGRKLGYPLYLSRPPIMFSCAGRATTAKLSSTSTSSTSTTSP